MNIVIALILSVVIVYAWAGLCFLFFRVGRPESEDRLRGFLEEHYTFFTERAFGETQREASRKAIQEAGSRGWIMTGLSIFSLSFDLTLQDLAVSCGVLFFGGLMLAYSWYGLRCLRLLGLESYAKQGT